MVIDNVMHIDVSTNVLGQLMHRDKYKGANHNMSSRLLYLVLLGLSEDKLVTIDYNKIRGYTAMSNNSIAISIKDLIDYKYIEKVSRGKYRIV